LLASWSCHPSGHGASQESNHTLNPEVEMNIVALIIQLLSGAAGGNLAGALLKKFSLGTLGNSIAGVLGGGIGGQLLSMLIGGTAGTAASGLDIGSILSSVAGGGVGGGLLMVVVGLIRQMMAKGS
jgi:hypothetical protein